MSPMIGKAIFMGAMPPAVDDGRRAGPDRDGVRAAMSIRRMRHVIALLLLLGGASVASAAGGQTVAGVEAVGITVKEMRAATDFYTRVLPSERSWLRKRCRAPNSSACSESSACAHGLRVSLGEELIELIDFLAPEGRTIPVDSRSNDEWFSTSRSSSAIWTQRTRIFSHDVAHASPSPQRLPDWNKNAGGIEAFYFRDPDGNHLEILEFPADKGDPRWHQPTDRLFLGIDHTAIVVRDTEEALRFYRDGLGMTVRGRSENYGIEQERLNNVFGARLRITAVSASSGLAIEFLEYLSPGTGRPMPADTRANDLWHWQIRMRADSLDSLSKRIAAQGGSLVSPGVIAMPQGAQFRNALHARGPTGHAVLIHDAAGAATKAERGQQCAWKQNTVVNVVQD